MSAGQNYRGHAIITVGEDIWAYKDTGQLVRSDINRSCGECGIANTPEGHDGCLGTLPGVMNACCGHGRESDAYIQYPDGSSIHGTEAKAKMAGLISRSSCCRK